MPHASRHRALALHRWFGVALALPLLLTLAAAALLWRAPLDRIAHPARYAVSGEARLPLDAYAAALHASGRRIARLALPAGPAPVVATTSSGATVWLDPPTARVLGTAPASAFDKGLRTTLESRWPRLVAALVGAALILVALTGLRLWLPTAGGWATALRWRRRPSASANLHYLLGAAAAVPLGLLGALAIRVSLLPVALAPPPALPLARTGLSAQQAADRALAVAGGPVRSITWPTGRTPDWHVRVADGEIAVADDSPIAVAVPERAAAPNLAFSATWCALLTLAAVAAAALAVTGAAMARRSG